MNSTKIAVLDVETTGLDPKSDRIIQVACLSLKEDCSPIKLFESYINPGKDVSKILKNRSHHIHKISPDALEHEPSFGQKAEEIFSVLKDVEFIVGHNIVFDWDMMRYEFARLDDISISDDDTDESWNADKRDKIIDLQKPGYWKDRFNNLKFQLVDTYRVAIVAYEDEQSYSLAFLARRFQLSVQKCKTVSYKWRKYDDFEEKELKIEQNYNRMPPHNAITDVLTTAEIFKDCLRILHITCADLLCCKHPEFLVNKQQIIEAERLMQGSPTNHELKKLAEIAPSQMNVVHPCRGHKLKDMKQNQIQLVIDYFSKKNLISDQRQALICQGFKLFVSDQNKFADGGENINKNQDDMAYGLRFDADSNKSVDDSSPLKNKMKEFRLSEQKANMPTTTESTIAPSSGHTVASKISKISEKFPQKNLEKFEAVVPDSEIFVCSGDLKEIERHEEAAATGLSQKEEVHLSEMLISPVFDRSMPASQDSFSQSILSIEYPKSTGVAFDTESQVFPLIDSGQKDSNEEANKAKKKLVL